MSDQNETPPESSSPEGTPSNKEFALMLSLAQLQQLLYIIVLGGFSLLGLWLTEHLGVAPAPSNGAGFWIIFIVSGSIVAVDYAMDRTLQSPIFTIVYWVGLPIADFIGKKLGIYEGEWLVWKALKYKPKIARSVESRLSN